MFFAEDTETILLQAATSVSSVAATDIVTMNDYHKVTFIVTTGTVTTGGGLSIREMDAVGDSVANESRFSLDYYWEKTAAASGSITKTSANTLSSAGGITVANGDDSKMFIFEVESNKLSGNNDCVALYFDDSTWNAASVMVMAVAHKARYKQGQPVTALA